MTPEQVAKGGSEHAHQAALFCWSNMAANYGFRAADNIKCYSEKLYAENTYGAYKTFFRIQELKWFFAIPNGGLRDKITAGKLKAEGVKKGVSDTMLPVNRGVYCGLWIEMKQPGKITATTPEQDEFGLFVQTQNYAFYVCDHWRDAADVVKTYLITV